MHRYIALLRGINVGGHKKILMADLRVLIESLGFTDVMTYIQSGNVVFSSSEVEGLDDIISEAIKTKYGWEVPVMVRTSSELASIMANCPFSEEKMQQSYFTILQSRPSEESIEALNVLNFPGEEFYVTPQCIYFFCAAGYQNTKMNSNFIERKIKISTTSRNYRTMVKLAALAN